jgi:phosphoglycerate dehydrogenase-like enzyme
MTRVVIWTGGDDSALAAALRERCAMDAVVATDASRCAAELARADAAVVNTVFWTRPMAAALAAAPRVRWLQLINAGYDNVETYGVAPHVVVTTRGGVGATLIAEHALTLLLASLRRIPAVSRAQAATRWGIGAQLGKVRSLAQLHTLIIGFGPVGQAIHSRLKAFGGRISVMASRARTESNAVDVLALASLPSLLPQLDAVILACPLVPATTGLFNAASFSQLKPGAHLINIARGAVVDTASLVAALNSGRLAGAALDVTDPEPLAADHPLWRCENVLITPHMAFSGGGEQVRADLADLIIDNARRFVADTPLRHVARIDPARAQSA